MLECKHHWLLRKCFWKLGQFSDHWYQISFTNRKIPYVIVLVFLPEKDAFIDKVKRVHEITAKKRATKKRGWYTKESMERKLNWSKPLSCIVMRCPCFGVYHIFYRFCHDHPIYLLYFGLLRSYIASVVKFCEKPGNERLIKNLAVSLGMLWVK